MINASNWAAVAVSPKPCPGLLPVATAAVPPVTVAVASPVAVAAASPTPIVGAASWLVLLLLGLVPAAAAGFAGGVSAAGVPSPAAVTAAADT